MQFKITNSLKYLKDSILPLDLIEGRRPADLNNTITIVFRDRHRNLISDKILNLTHSDTKLWNYWYHQGDPLYGFRIKSLKLQTNESIRTDNKISR